MAELSKDPKGWELEDLVSAHFASRACYVETSIKERNPDEILELDVVWTDYRDSSEVRHPVEVKSGEWHLPDIFKFYGWTQYLRLEPGLFIHKESHGRLDPETLKRVEERTGIRRVYVPTPEPAEAYFNSLGLEEPAWSDLPQLWRYSFWARRRMVKALGKAIEELQGRMC